MIRELKEENERLKATLGNYNPAEGGGANKMMSKCGWGWGGLDSVCIDGYYSSGVQ